MNSRRLNVVAQVGKHHYLVLLDSKNEECVMIDLFCKQVSEPKPKKEFMRRGAKWKATDMSNLSPTFKKSICDMLTKAGY